MTPETKKALEIVAKDIPRFMGLYVYFKRGAEWMHDHRQAEIETIRRIAIKNSEDLLAQIKELERKLSMVEEYAEMTADEMDNP